MRFAADLIAILARDDFRCQALASVRTLALPDGWIGAGFVRDAIWDHLHGHPPGSSTGDVDVVWFDPTRAQTDEDRAIESRLHDLSPRFAWSVKNQARMHIRNGDRPYGSVAQALRFWPETATAVAVRLTSANRLEVNAPFGLDDLFALRLVPTPTFESGRRRIFDERVAQKQWLLRYPRLQMA